MRKVQNHEEQLVAGAGAAAAKAPRAGPTTEPWNLSRFLWLTVGGESSQHSCVSLPRRSAQQTHRVTAASTVE